MLLEGDFVYVRGLAHQSDISRGVVQVDCGDIDVCYRDARLCDNWQYGTRCAIWVVQSLVIDDYSGGVRRDGRHFGMLGVWRGRSCWIRGGQTTKDS